MRLETYVRVWYDISMQNYKSEKNRLQSVYSIRKADIVLIIGCLFTAVCLGLFFLLHRDEGRMARITCDGVEAAVILFRDTEPGEQFYLIRNTGKDVVTEVFDAYPVLPEEGNYNLLSVEDGKVCMAASDCRDQICVRHRPVSGSGESIICLPHRLVVEITGDTEVILDGVVE